MANVYFTNYTLNTANDAFSAIWKLTRALKKAGWIYKASSDSNSKDTTGVATNDKWGGNADPALDSYPSFPSPGTYAWWVAQGPSTLKIPFTVASTGTFLRGEKITQATSLAEGELIGYEYDGSSTGHLVVLPRTGTFNNTNVITGAGSGATLTPSGSIKTFVREVMFQKSNDFVNGTIALQTICVEDEDGYRFSTLASSAAGCTELVAPGGGGTDNTFPTVGSYLIGGRYLSGSYTHGNWFGVTSNLGRAQIVATNATPGTNISADGTWWIGAGVTSSATKFNFFGFFRLDNTEDGDLDPFAAYKSSTLSYNDSETRVQSFDSDIDQSPNYFITTYQQHNSWKALRRRGFPTNDDFVICYCAVFSDISSTKVMGMDNSNAETVACSYSSKRIREPITLVSTTLSKKIRKGTIRWAYQVQGGATFDTFDSKRFLVVLNPGSSTGAILLGPYDGSTTPLQS